MVNHGASRACLICKARRIRCDEVRPMCRRCIKSRRTCLGYIEEVAVGVKRHTPRSGILQHIVSPYQASELKSEWKTIEAAQDSGTRVALARFFSNFVLVSNDRTVSRGYFDGIDELLVRLGQDSPLFSATRLVATIYAADTSEYPSILEKTRHQYPIVLMAFQKSLSDPSRYSSDEALMTAAMLGLYEMIVSEEASPDVYSAHVKGLAAILDTRDSLPHTLPGVRLFQCYNSILSAALSQNERTITLFTPQPTLDTISATRNMDTLMMRMRPVLLRATSLLGNLQTSKTDLNNLKQEVILLNKEFSLWPLLLPQEWKAQSLGHIERTAQKNNDDAEIMPFWPGKIDSYYDLYVVAVWDAYRKSRLKLLQVILDCSTRLDSVSHIPDQSTMIQRLQREAGDVANELCASVPFHLTADLLGCLKPGDAMDSFNAPGKALGGLLLMYPLYIASTLSLIPLEQRTWMKGRLRWIGKYMGIRQATMLANTDSIRHLAIADGHSLVFSGSLISPT